MTQPQSQPEVRVYRDPDALAAEAAARVAQAAADVIRERGRFTLALSGGSTPEKLYALLATPEWRARLDWSKAYVFFGDEKLSSGSLLVPNSPYFLGLFLCQSDPVGHAYQGRYFKAGGRYVCVDRAKAGETVTTDFEINEAFKRYFGQSDTPYISGLGIAIDTDPELLRWLLDRRIFLCGPTGFAVIASSAMFAVTERALAEDVEQVRLQAGRANRAADTAIEAVNLSTTHLQRFLSARRRELDALEGFRASVEPLTEASATPTPLPLVRRADEQSA